MRALPVLLALVAASAPALALPLVEEPPAVGPVHPYHTWETLTLELQELVAEHPDIARLHSAGQSVLGLDLWVVEIADFLNPAQVPLERREVVWLDGGTHANEQLGMMLAWLWAKFLLEEYETNETARWIVENRHTWVLPMLNPDGNHMDSRWNAHGVNINRNYPVGWGKVDESLVGNNPGPYAMSEPETRGVVEFVQRVRPDYFNSFHTGVDMMLFPVGYAEVQAADHAMFQRVCDELGETDPSFCGPVFSTIYPASGIAVDFGYFDVGAASWTYEVSPEGFLYASLEDPRVRLERYWRGVEHAFLNTERYGAHLRIASLRLLDDGRTLTIEAVVENDGYGNLTWGDVGFALPDGSRASARVAGLASGASQALRVAVPKTSEAGPGDLEVGFVYPKRLVPSSPLAGALDRIPVLQQAGRLVAEVVPEAPLSPLAAQQAVPGWEPALLLLALGPVALAARRRR